MRKRGILVGIILLLILTGCGGGDAETCTLSDERCRYYSGTDGIRVEPEFYNEELIYHSRDRLDQNEVSVEYSLKNVGASASFGAIYLAGLPTAIFDIYREDGEGNLRPVQGGRGCDFGLSFQGGLNNALGIFFGGTPGTGCELGAGIFDDGGYGYIGIQTLLSAFDQNGNINALFESMGLPPPEGNVQLTYDEDEGFGVSGNIDIGRSFFDIYPYGLGILGILGRFPLGSLNGNPFVLHGDTPSTPGGEEAFRAFKIQLGSWPVGQDTMNYDYEIRTCYAYTTFISPELCIDAQPRVNEDGKICRADRTISLGTQGAPVAITQMRQETNRRSIQIWFTIENVGDGRVVNLENLMACSPYYATRVKERDLYDTVYMPNVYLGNRPNRVECSENKIRLQNGRAEVRCSYDLTQPSVDSVDTGYTLPIEMELWYGYQEKDRRNLRVERIG